jgi:tetratricopeptide (TPR) repeat protein
MSKDASQDINSALDACLVLIQEEGLGLEECIERFPNQREELSRLLPAALRLREGRSLTASDDLRISLAARLKGLPQVDRQNSPGFLVTNLAALRSIFRNPNPQRRALMIPALITFLIVTVLSMSGLVASADAAGPGDFLFGLDTAIEDVRLSFTFDEENEVKLRLEFATERLEELKIKIEGEGDAEDIERALAEFEEAIAAIEALLGDLTPEQRAEYEAALALLRASSQELTEFEFGFELEDGLIEIEIELEFGDDDDDIEDDLDDDCESSGPGSGDCQDDDEDDDEGEDCDSSGSGSSDCRNGDDEEDECDSSGSDSGDDCEDSHDDGEHNDDNDDDDEDDDDEDDEEDDD